MPGRHYGGQGRGGGAGGEGGAEGVWRGDVEEVGTRAGGGGGGMGARTGCGWCLSVSYHAVAQTNAQTSAALEAIS